MELSQWWQLLIAGDKLPKEARDALDKHIKKKNGKK